jgi:aspartate/methionine/tyrosine aminotransferase
MTHVSAKARLFTESVIREMTRLAIRHGAINLAQGFPDFPAPREIKDAAAAAVQADINQYAITWGSKRLRDAIVAKSERLYGFPVDPETEVCVTCGATEAMFSTILALVDPGDAVVVFEPFYENYGPDAILAGAAPRYVRLSEPDWSFDRGELARAMDGARAVIINTPNNPTGKVFSEEELREIAALCVKHDVVAITDEIYEHLVYEGVRHVLMAALPDMRERTVTINALSKTYSVTGWRVGWAIASPPLTDAIRKVHDFVTVGAAAPLQEAGAAALALPDAYYAGIGRDYAHRRETMLGILENAGFRTFSPKGAYYILTDISGFGFSDDVAFARWLVSEVGVAAVPGSSFYARPSDGRERLRFSFCKKPETLQAAGERLAGLRAKLPRR